MTDGTPLGRYILERRLAAGGMAEVLLAYLPGPTNFKKYVVIKRILPHLKDDPKIVRMFEDEARIAAQLNHPNLVQAYEFSRINGEYCLVMEYLDGRDLFEIAQQCRLLDIEIPRELICYIAAQACIGLNHAHRLRDESGSPLNLIHRDISPTNVLVTWQGGVKLVDFGVAKYEGSNTTEIGVLKGKMGYMSPEQVRGRELDHRTDIFSMGLLLYELVMGRPLFRFKNIADLSATLYDFNGISKRELNEIPKHLRAPIGKMLEPGVGDRFQGADQVSRALEATLATRPLPSDLEDFLNELFEKTTIHPRPQARCSMSRGEVAVSEDLIDPTVIVNAERVTRLLSEFDDPTARQPALLDEDDTFDTDIRDPFTETRTTEDTNVEPLDPFEEARTDEERAVDLPSEDTISHRAYRTGDGVTELVPREDGLTRAAAYVLDRDTRNTWAVWFVAAVVVGFLLFILASVTRREEPIRAVTVALEEVTPPPTAGAVVAAQPQNTQPPPGFPTPIPPSEAFDGAPEVPPVESVPERPDESTESAKTPSVPIAPASPSTQETKGATRRAPRAKGFVALESDPVTEVWIDGRKVGRTPLRKAWPAGSVKIELRVPRSRVRKTVSVTIKSGKETRRKVTFGKGKIALKIEPWAHVFMDGKKLGTTPIAPIEVYEGAHEVTLHNPDVPKKKTLRVVVQAGKVAKVVERLE